LKKRLKERKGLSLEKVNSDAKTIIGINLIGIINSIAAVLLIKI